MFHRENLRTSQGFYIKNTIHKGTPKNVESKNENQIYEIAVHFYSSKNCETTVNSGQKVQFYLNQISRSTH